MKNMKTIFILSLIFCFISAGFMPSGIEKAGVIGNAKADYVNASNNTNCIEEDPLVPGWSKDVRLTNDSADSNHPDIAIDSNNNIHVVYEDHRTGSWEIWYKRSEDGGKSWSVDRNLFDFPGTDATASITIYKNEIHVVWRHGSVEESETYYIKSEDGGENWSPYRRLTNAYGCSFAPKIIACKSVLHVVWFDSRDGNYEIYYKKSIDCGEQWGNDTRLTNDSGVSRLPSMTVDAIGNIYLLWEDNRGGGFDLYFKKSTDYGVTWSNYTQVTNNSAMGDALLSGLSDIKVDILGNIHIVWADVTTQGGSQDIFYKKSENQGDTWGSGMRLTEKFGDTDSHMPSLVTASNVVGIVWYTTNFTYIEGEGSCVIWGDVCFAESVNGSVWDVYRLTNMDGAGICPVGCIDSKMVFHIVWANDMLEATSNHEIFYKRTLNPVTEPPITVTGSLNQSTCKPESSITVSGNAVYNDSIVPNADVSIKIVGRGAEWNTTTDLNGDYSEIIVAPNTPGNYTIMVTITWDNITSGNHTGWKMTKLTVEQESTNGGTTNGDTTNGGQQPDGEENKYGINLNYVIGVIGVIAVCVITGVVLVKRRGRPAAKTEKEKTEKPTMGLRCPKCKKTFRVEVKPKPFNVKCPYCGREGVIK